MQEFSKMTTSKCRSALFQNVTGFTTYIFVKKSPQGHPHYIRLNAQRWAWIVYTSQGSFPGDFSSCEVKAHPPPEVARGLVLGKLLLSTDYNIWIG